MGLAVNPDVEASFDSFEAITHVSEIRRLVDTLPFVPPGRVELQVDQRSKAGRTGEFSLYHTKERVDAEPLYRIADSICVVSLTTCLLQIARKERLISLIEALMELSGSYTLCEYAPRGFKSHAPITTVERLSASLATIEGRHGVKTIKRALKVAASGSASPRETELYLALSLPRSQGGYALPRPEMAKRIDVPEELIGSLNSRYVLADLCWPKQKVIVEYDGRTDHTSEEDVIHDKSRRSLLASMGYSVLVFTSEDMRNSVDFGHRVKQLRRALGIRIRSNRTSDGFEQQSNAARLKLINYLFNPRHHGASPATCALKPRICMGNNLSEID